MAIEEHIKVLRKGVEAWNSWRASTPIEPDLSDITFYDKMPLSQGELLRIEGLDLSNVNFRGANLKKADFYDGYRQGANIANANLQEADLTAAKLREANVCGADLAFANVTNTEFQDAVFKDTNLTGAKLWKAKLFPSQLTDLSPEQYDNDVLTDKPVKNVGDLLERIQRIEQLYSEQEQPVQFYFRGESTTDWELIPSVMRSDSRKYEGEMLVDLASRRPDEFNSMTSALGRWVLAQHHELRTRFLDVTKNPLVALFNACGGSEDEEGKYKGKPGRLHIFAVPPKLVKPYTSDVVSVIANFARLSQFDQDLVLSKRALSDETGKSITPVSSAPRYSRAMLYLYQYIKQEKPYFEERIDPRDFYRVFVVEPQQSSERLRAQSGAFLISAFHKRFERVAVLEKNPGIPVYAYYKLDVGECKHKANMMRELKMLNISKESLRPGLDSAAQAVTAKYGP